MGVYVCRVLVEEEIDGLLVVLFVLLLKNEVLLPHCILLLCFHYHNK